MNKVKVFVSAFIFLLMGMSMAHAQKMDPQEIDSITNKELKKVAATLQEARQIQRTASQKLREVVKESDLEFQRYQTIMISRQKKDDTVEVTQEEKEIIKEIQPKLAEINRQSKQKFNKVIKEHGLTQQRFQQIVLVLRTKPEVAQRFQKIMAEQIQQNQP